MSPEAPGGAQYGSEQKDFAVIVAEEADVTSCTPGFLQRLAANRLWHIEATAKPDGSISAFIWKKVLVWTKNPGEHR